MVRNFSSLTSKGVEINILMDIVVSESNYGDCQRGKDAAKELMDLTKSAGVPPANIMGVVATLKSMSAKTEECLRGTI